MVTKSTAFPSTFYKATDITSPILLTIASVTPERLGEGRDAQDKYVASFEEQGSKLLVVSSTKWDAIALIARTDESDNWPGTRIVLYRDKVTFGGKLVDGIKIRAPRALAQASKPSLEVPVEPSNRAIPAISQDLDDEIPF